VNLSKDEANGRVQSIVAVLAHYEANSTMPFNIFGITLTRDLLTVTTAMGGLEHTHRESGRIA